LKPETIKQLNLILIIILISFPFFKWESLPPQIPLFYSRPWGQDQLAPKILIFLLPAVSFVVFLLNSLLVKWLFKKAGDLLVKTSFLVSLAISFLCLFSLFKIVFLIT